MRFVSKKPFKHAAVERKAEVSAGHNASGGTIDSDAGQINVAIYVPIDRICMLRLVTRRQKCLEIISRPSKIFPDVLTCIGRLSGTFESYIKIRRGLISWRHAAKRTCVCQCIRRFLFLAEKSYLEVLASGAASVTWQPGGFSARSERNCPVEPSEPCRCIPARLKACRTRRASSFRKAIL